MSEIHHPAMELEDTTYHCSHCDCDIALSNQLTHDVACARMQRNTNQRVPAPQRIVRHSSSSSALDQFDNQPRVQAVPKREERRVFDNKLVACPNCEKSVREQEMESHINNECLKKELIPCEFCDESIPMSDYGKHVEGCQRRNQNQQNNNRDESPLRERPENAMEEESDDVPQEGNERDRSPERGGIRGFFRNLAGSAANQLRNYNEYLQRQVEEREQQREEQQRRQQEMLQHMFGQSQVPRNIPNNQLVPYGSNSRPRVIRTVERGPGGTIIVSSRVVPSNEPQMPQGMPNGPIQMGMDPIEMLFGMMAGRMGGMHAINNGELGQPESTGLDKETIDSLALVKYSNDMNKNVDEESRKCPICLDQFEEGQEVRFLWCMHRFHKNCVDQWLDSHTNCPICKKDFSEAEQGFSP